MKKIKKKSLPILKLSTSSIKTYEQCPRKYWFQYIEKPDIEKKDWDHLKLGNFIHEVLEHFHNELNTNKSQDIRNLMSTICKRVERFKEKDQFKYKLTSELRKQVRSILMDYILLLEENGLPPVKSTEEKFAVELDNNVIIRGVIDRVDEPDGYTHLVDYKGLALDTPIPTPTGWATMESLKVGDFVIGSTGNPTKIIAKSNIHNRPCFKLILNDGSSVICDNVHLWKAGFLKQDSDIFYKVISASELYSTFYSSAHTDIVIENHKPFVLAEQDLPVDPLIFGMRLKEGSFKLGEDFERKIKNTRIVPMSYLRASLDQRIALLNGLMGIDTEHNTDRKLHTFETDSKMLYRFIIELIRTFGISVQKDLMPRLTSSEHHFYHLAISSLDINKLKSNNKSQKDKNKSSYRKIVGIEKVDSVPTQCIAVDSPDSLYLCGEGMIVTHNTGKSKYLDSFQLLVYGIPLIHQDPKLEWYKGSYLVLKENMKMLSYKFSRKDVESTINKIEDVARQIREDKTWEPRPQFLCNYCDFQSICDASISKNKSSYKPRGEIGWE